MYIILIPEPVSEKNFTLNNYENQAKGKGTMTSDSVAGSSPAVLTLPSEAAQYLANHLVNLQWAYTEEQQAAIHNDELAWVIQEYWDSLP